jgi:hypothetical protein
MTLVGFHGPVSRLTFGYVGQEIWLLSEYVVEMTMTRSDSAGVPGPALRVELRDRNGAVAYSQKVASPLQASPEVFAPDGSVTRMDILRPRGVFVAVVPFIEDARTLVVAAQVLDPEDSDSFRELGRFDLTARGRTRG